MSTHPILRAPERGSSPRSTRSRALAGLAVVAAAALTAGGLAFASPAAADTKPLSASNPKTPVTVSADSLPTPQINGVVWTQTVVGNLVFVGGKFTTARPYGVALGGVGTVTRSNILAYSLTTGKLDAAFAPKLNGQVRTIVATPDHKHVYVGGSFTAVGSRAAKRVVELSATTGAVVKAFHAAASGEVDALALRSDHKTLFMGGSFTSVNSKTRSRLAAVAADVGALRSWRPTANGTVRSIVIDPDYSKVVVGGAFTRLAGSTNPGYGIGALSPTTGAIKPWKMNSSIRDGGANASITSLVSDSTGVYGSGYVFGGGGNFEGTFRASWSTGAITWMEDCHGDSYSIAVTANAAYVAGHAHYCGNVAGFPGDPTGVHYRAIAFSKTATQKITKNTVGTYTNWAGQPAPSLLDWFPDFNTGTYTGLTQGPWSVAASTKYVLYGGEFTTVNGIAQQGLARFAVPSLAPNKIGPQESGYFFTPTVTAASVPAVAGGTATTGRATVSWTANTDPDNTLLTYKVWRNGDWSTPVYTVTASSTFWNTPTLTWKDPTVYASGTSVSYRITATDPWGNVATGDGKSVTIP